MDSSQTAYDQTDHHTVPYNHEIHVSVNDDSKHQPATITPTPSPRSAKSTLTSEVASTNSDERDMLPRSTNGKHAATSNHNGLDNPAFETDKTSQRPLSSFGPNGMSEINLKEPANGKPADKPLGEHLFFFWPYYPQLFIYFWHLI